jgi:hypothetical protein
VLIRLVAPCRNLTSMATNPIDPIAEEIQGILDAHPELHQRLDRLEREIADGTVTE